MNEHTRICGYCHRGIPNIDKIEGIGKQGVCSNRLCGYSSPIGISHSDAIRKWNDANSRFDTSFMNITSVGHRLMAIDKNGDIWMYHEPARFEDRGWVLLNMQKLEHDKEVVDGPIPNQSPTGFYHLEKDPKDEKR